MNEREDRDRDLRACLLHRICKCSLREDELIREFDLPLS